MPFSARVLVFDKDQSHPLGIDGLLKKEVYRSFTATTIDEATSIAGNSRPYIAIFNAGDGDGGAVESIGELKDHWSAKHMPLIVIGENTDDEKKASEINEGMADFLFRPFDDVELISRLTSLVRLNTMQEEISRQHATAQKFGVDAPRRAGIEGSKGPFSVLILSANGDDAESLTLAFGDQAHVNVAGDSYAAMDFLLENECGARIVAVRDSESNLLEFCRDVRRNSRLYNLPIIATAPPGLGASTEQIYSAGANEFLPLPVQDAELLLRTRALIRQNEYRSAMRGIFHRARTAMTSDGLTGLYSYGFLHEHLASLIKDAEDREKNLAIGFFDQGIE